MKKRKIIIIGGGFGGAFAAKELSKQGGKQFDIELISDRNYFVFQPLLPEVAAGTINAQDAVTPLRLLLPNIKIRLADVKAIDHKKQTVTILQGRKRILQELDYDDLIIGSGQVTDLSLFPGFLQHSLTMKDLSDAYKLRNHVIQCMELADVTRFEDIKKMALTFVVAGGGFSGVETLGEVLEMVHRVRKYYPNIKKEDIKAIIIQRGSGLLQEMPEKLGQYASEQLKKRGATVMLNTGIESASATTVCTDKGDIIPTMTIVTTIGNGPSDFIKALPFEQSRGKLITNSYLQVKAHDNIWALGDTAAIPLETDAKGNTRYAPPTAQFAVQEAKLLARNLIAFSKGKEPLPFNYKPKGMMASLGAYKGVVQMGSIRITGLLAWLLWRALYIGMLPHFSTRLRVALNWLFDYFMPRTIVQMAHAESSALIRRHYRDGEVVYERDELIPGFFIVMSGQFKLSLQTKEGEMLEKILNKGDHGGDQVIQASSLTLGKLENVKKGELLFINRDDFTQLCEVIPVMSAHLNVNADQNIKTLLAERTKEEV
ncbi:MAG: FAD-dependent oxidoreductase [Cellvibrionaceae bacterium]